MARYCSFPAICNCLKTKACLRFLRVVISIRCERITPSDRPGTDNVGTPRTPRPLRVFETSSDFVATAPIMRLAEKVHHGNKAPLRTQPDDSSTQNGHDPTKAAASQSRRRACLTVASWRRSACLAIFAASCSRCGFLFSILAVKSYDRKV